MVQQLSEDDVLWNSPNFGVLSSPPYNPLPPNPLQGWYEYLWCQASKIPLRNFTMETTGEESVTTPGKWFHWCTRTARDYLENDNNSNETYWVTALYQWCWTGWQRWWWENKDDNTIYPGIVNRTKSNIRINRMPLNSIKWLDLIAKSHAIIEFTILLLFNLFQLPNAIKSSHMIAFDCIWFPNHLIDYAGYILMEMI